VPFIWTRDRAAAPTASTRGCSPGCCWSSCRPAPGSCWSRHNGG